MAAEFVQTVYDPADFSNDFPSTSTTQSNTFNQQSFCHKCEICSQAFTTVAELNAHRQQGCEGLIDMDSIAMDCKPTAVDITESESDIKASENQTRYDADGLNVNYEQLTNSKSFVNRRKRKNPEVGNKLSQNKKKNSKKERLDRQSLIGNHPCDKSNKNNEFRNKYSPNVHHLLSHHPNERQFECWLCHKP